MDFKNKDILVTGGAGFIGSNLVLRLVREGARVTVIDSFVEGCGANLFNLSPSLKDIKLERVDLRDKAAMTKLLGPQEFIFNLAGNVSHQDSMTHPQMDLDLNVVAHLNFLEVCRKQSKGAVVLYASTRQFYGSPQYLPVDEKHHVRPIDVNGIHKLAAENYHLLYAKVYGMKTISLRLTNTYGPRQLIRHARQGVIGWFANRAVTGNPIQLFGDGLQVRDFNYVDDVVDAMLLAVQSETCFGDFFNLSGEVTSLKEVATKFCECVGGGKLEIVPFPPERKGIDIGNFYGDSQKFQKATGWKPKTSLNTGLKLMTEYFKVNKSHYLDGQ